MVSALISRSNGLVSIPGQGHFFVFLGNTLNSHSASLHPGSGCSKAGLRYPPDKSLSSG